MSLANSYNPAFWLTTYTPIAFTNLSTAVSLQGILILETGFGDATRIRTVIPALMQMTDQSAVSVLTEDIARYSRLENPGHLSPENHSTLSRQDENLPAHWNIEFSIMRPLDTFARITFQFLIFISLGHPNLVSIWRICHAGEKEWTEQKDRLIQRITIIMVVAGLLLSATASFITTTPPMGSLVNYTLGGPYKLLILSFGLTLGALIVGSAMIFVMAKCQATWFCETLMSSRSRIICTLILVAYPFIVIGISTIIAALGLIVAALKSDDPLIKAGSVITLLLPISLIPLFVWTQIPILRRDVQRTPPYQGDRKTTYSTISTAVPSSSRVPHTTDLPVPPWWARNYSNRSLHPNPYEQTQPPVPPMQCPTNTHLPQAV